MDQQYLDITPDPKVLIALTHTPIKPLDALCELVDNALDSYFAARLQGEPVARPVVRITIPGATAVKRGEGAILVQDNGPGLDEELLGNALRAGFSGKNKFDTLGLFGMGFNISTGKLGKKTLVTTARARDDFALQVELDLPTIVASRSFNIPVRRVPKPGDLPQGTRVEVGDWWSHGDANSGFAAQLAGLARTQLRAQLGRRYASILRREVTDRVQVFINNESVDAFEHCVWSPSRFVERRGYGNIYARQTMSSVVHTQRRCEEDGSIVPASSDYCLECGQARFRTIDERVEGWVGIQRFDHSDNFGIDLIRNGRAIRVNEKDAFFNFTNDFGESIREYPVDQQFGRIVGEVHLNHVPVDFSKQDFQRASEEWQRAISFLRGASLLPTNWIDGKPNDAPVSVLFQGYRKVRNFGTQDLYMGTWDPVQRKAVRLPREVERDFYARFQAHEDGYHDDRLWWDRVVNASQPPLEELLTCPQCSFQNSPDAERCDDCGHLFKAKECAACKQSIPSSSIVCELCGASQVPEVHEPWRCLVCEASNGIDDDQCYRCQAVRGTAAPWSPHELRAKSSRLEELCLAELRVTLSDGSRSEPLDITAFSTSKILPRWDGEPVPTTALRSPGKIDIFIDESHPVFIDFRIDPKEAVAVEAAQYLYNSRSDLTGKPGHTVYNLATSVLTEAWSGSFLESAATLSDAVSDLFRQIAARLATVSRAQDFYNDLSDGDKRGLAEQLIGANLLDKLPELRETGAYLEYLPADALARIFSIDPACWFGTVWVDAYPDSSVLGLVAAESAQLQLVGNYQRCLDDCAAFARYKYNDDLVSARASLAREYLESHLA